jgi:hypothetical protein
VSEPKFKEILTKHSQAMSKTIRELSQGKKPADESLAELEKVLDQELQVDMKRESGVLLEALGLVNQKLKKMEAGSTTLTPEELLERRVLLLARRLQLEQQPSPQPTGTVQVHAPAPRPIEAAPPIAAVSTVGRTSPDPAARIENKPESK